MRFLIEVIIVARRELTLPKMLIRKRSAGPGLQILLEDRRSMVVVEANGGNDSPGSIPGSVGRGALIVSG